MKRARGSVSSIRLIIAVATVIAVPAGASSLEAATPVFAAVPTNASEALDLGSLMSSSASLSDFNFKGWDVGAWAHVRRGVLGASEGMCVFASRTTYRGDDPVRMITTREVGCTSRPLDDLVGATRWNRVDPFAWGASVEGVVRTHVWRDVYVWGDQPTEWRQWELVKSSHSRAAARLNLRWVGATEETDWGAAWWGPGVQPHAVPPVCIFYGPPFVGPCLHGEAGASRPATVEGRISFDRLGVVRLHDHDGPYGRLKMYASVTGGHCEGEC